MISGQKFLDLAGHLVVNASFSCHETRYRSAISRAYYGAFHLAVEFLSEFGATVPRGPQGHEIAWRSLYSLPIRAAKDAANHLNELRGIRNKADYALDWKGMDSLRNAQDKVQMAHLVKSKLDECRLEPNRIQVIAALKDQGG